MSEHKKKIMRDYQKKYRKTQKNIDYIKAYQKTPKYKYCQHRMHAKYRNIKWLFTFEEWWAIWEPHWEKRGQESSGLQMCRYGDSGPYSPENVRIDTLANNIKEMWEIRRKS